MRLVVVCVAATLAGCCPPLKIALRPQEASGWCWASATQMALEASGRSVAQCTIVSQRFPQVSGGCCTGACPTSACDEGGWPLLDPFGMESTTSPVPLEFEAIRRELCREKRPLLYAYRSRSGGASPGHIVVVFGVTGSGPDRALLVHDPWAPCVGDSRAIAYEEYAGGEGDVHLATIHAMRRAQ